MISPIAAIEAYEKLVKPKHKGVRVQIDCPLGLWGVDCPNMETAQREARHYFIQYYLDGEYDALLSEIDAQQ